MTLTLLNQLSFFSPHHTWHILVLFQKTTFSLIFQGNTLSWFSFCHIGLSFLVFLLHIFSFPFTLKQDQSLNLLFSLCTLTLLKISSRLLALNIIFILMIPKLLSLAQTFPWLLVLNIRLPAKHLHMSKAKLSIFPICSSYSLSHLSKQQLHPSNLPGQKSWRYPWHLFSLSNIMYYQQILLALLSQMYPKLTMSYHFQHYCSTPCLPSYMDDQNNLLTGLSTFISDPCSLFHQHNSMNVL